MHRGQDELDRAAHEAGGVGGAGELVHLPAGFGGQDEFAHQAGGLDAFGVVDVGQAFAVTGAALGDVGGDDLVARAEQVQ
ncbi:hypothetical protein GCM10028784_16860 [Myceligenerans cantabricum]